jgi:hypothetical protein
MRMRADVCPSDSMTTSIPRWSSLRVAARTLVSLDRCRFFAFLTPPRRFPSAI